MLTLDKMTGQNGYLQQSSHTMTKYRHLQVTLYSLLTTIVTLLKDPTFILRFKVSLPNNLENI